jgi:hypothetical protein
LDFLIRILIVLLAKRVCQEDEVSSVTELEEIEKLLFEDLTELLKEPASRTLNPIKNEPVLVFKEYHSETDGAVADL